MAFGVETLGVEVASQRIDANEYIQLDSFLLRGIFFGAFPQTRSGEDLATGMIRAREWKGVQNIFICDDLLYNKRCNLTDGG